MILPRAIALALALCLPLPVQAGRVCPPANLDEPLPGVAEVTLHQASVSTARFPGQWQEGEYGGGKLAYRLYADGSGTVSNDLRLRGWHVDFACDLTARSCIYASTSAPPAEAAEAARAIGACLTARPPRARERPASLAAAESPPASTPQDSAPAPQAQAKNTVLPKATGPDLSPHGTAPTPATPHPAPTSAKHTPSVEPGRPASGRPAPAAHPPAAAQTPPVAANPPAKSARATSTPDTARRAPAQTSAPSAPFPRATRSTPAQPALIAAPRDPVPVPALPPQQDAAAPPVRAKGATAIAEVPAPTLPTCLSSRPAGPATAPLSCNNPAGAKPSLACRPASVAVCARPISPSTSHCWADHLPDESAPSRLQRLLLLAGFDAGPLDGRPGARTRAALIHALGASATAASEPQLIAALRAILCQRQHAN